MSKKEEERPVIYVTEDSWEEDTGEVDVLELEEGLSCLDSSPESPPVFADSEPPSRGFTQSLKRGSTQPSLSVGEHLARARRIGTGIWYSGVFLWAYLIVGELVVGAGLPEFLGWSAFVGIVVGGFLHGANRIGIPAMRKAASISIGSVGVGVVLITALAGSSVRSEYQALSLVLLIAAVSLIFLGLRYTRGGLPKLPGPTAIRWPRLALWVLFLGQTALVAASLLS